MEWKYLLGSLYWRGVLQSLEEFQFYLNLTAPTPDLLTQKAQSQKLYQYLQSETSWVAQGKREWEWCHDHNVHLTVPGDEDYPFEHLEKPPLLLSYMGRPCWQERECLSIVGSRDAGSDSLLWMETHLPRLLQSLDLTLVSGGARGVDQKAHGISLQMAQPTLSLLPSGLGQIYPKSFRSWLSPIQRYGGAIMSAFPPHCLTKKHHFYERNRLIAGIAKVVFVVEGRRKSGSLLTAKHALNLGRTLCALPGSPLDKKALGTLDLLADGALMIRDHTDLYVALHAYT